jgi:hypothetical protein
MKDTKDTVQNSTNQQDYPTINRSLSYVSHLRKRRNERKLRHGIREITINSYTLISIRRLRSQFTNDLLTNQFFNGSPFY